MSVGVVQGGSKNLDGRIAALEAKLADLRAQQVEAAGGAAQSEIFANFPRPASKAQLGAVKAAKPLVAKTPAKPVKKAPRK